jgi:S1-C subfamily serine protease
MLKLRVVLLLLALLIAAHPCYGKIYKYKKDGVWYYTDTPPKDQIANSEQMIETGKSAPAPSQTGTLLLQDHVTRNAIEEASAATVAIKTAMGYGSGFFISTSGHIITNKHVIRTPAKTSRKINDYIDRVDSRVEDIEKRFKEEKQQLKDYQEKLKRLKKLAENEEDPSRKKSYEEEYDYRKKEYDDWNKRYKERLKEFKKQRKQYQTGRGEYGYSSSVANLQRSFTIILVDNTELYARLVTTSKKHDLALLKLDGYKTPALTPGAPYELAQGNPVYAIGNPANLRNTVTSGIFSGFADSFIQTNAQINPGNSGGPLVDPQGKVLGVNTKKKIGSAIEGLGFAIPIQTALTEFSSYLP